MALSGVVRAAGGVVVRTKPDGSVEVALVHRPAYDDWTLPKGKLQAGEREEHTALREVEEETGMRCRLERALGSTKYKDHKGRQKVVHYWVMRALDGHFKATKEVDELRWVPLTEAIDSLSYHHDRTLLQEGFEGHAVSASPGSRDGRVTMRGRTTGAIYLVRHAKAGSRAQWEGPDDLRPLTKGGRRQADALVDRLAAFSIARIVSSPHARCVETVAPLAARRGLTVENIDALVEGSDGDDVLDFLARTAPDPTVVCSHGDVIGDVLTRLVEQGLAVESDLRWEKGSTWVLDFDGESFLYGRYLPPP
jgi:broad specificity phosphatase PhoE/8-oxo-dGTP pyrophosphatase MutT (NUDIX family)